MSNYRLRKGLHVRLKGLGEHVIETRLPGGGFQLRNVATNEYRPIEECDLVARFFDGDIEILGDEQGATLAGRSSAELLVTDLSLLGENLRQQTRRRQAYVREVGARKLTKLTAETVAPVIDDVSKELGDESPPSWVTLYRWCRQYWASGGDVRALVPAYRKRGNRRRKFSGRDSDKAEATVKIIERVIAEKYLSKHRPTVESVYDAVCAQIIGTNRFRDPDDRLSLPHKSSVYDVVSKLDPYDVMRARHGERAAEQMYGTKRQGARPTRPLERVEIDHTKLDMLVVDLERRLPVGRPWLTVSKDKYSRAITGLYIGFDPPGYLSVMHCLRHAIKPKGYVKERYPDIIHAWDAHGIPEVIVTDNGPEFHSTHFEDACLQLGIVIDYAPPKRGQYKGSVERFFRTQNQQLLHGKPGTTFSNIVERGDYDPKKHAVISAEVLEELVHRYIIDVYHQSEHRGIYDVPARVWKEGITEYPPGFPSSHADLDILLGCIELRTISASGIELHSLRYNDDCLARLRRRLKKGERVRIKYDPSDLSMIHVADEDAGKFIPVPAVNQSYASGLTLWQHRVIRHFAKQRNKDNTDPVALCLAKDEIQRIVEREWETTKKTQTRQKMARYRQQDWPMETERVQVDRGEQFKLEAIKAGSGLPRLIGAGPRHGLKDVSTSASRKVFRVPRDELPGSEQEEKTKFESPGGGETGADSELDMTGWEADYGLPGKGAGRE